MNRKQRLLKLVVLSHTYDTRLKAEQAIRQGKVLVDGKPFIDPTYQLDPKKSKITIDGKPLKAISPVTLYYAFNKPLDVTCEKNEVSNVYHFLRRLKLGDDQTRSLFCVGRLDKDTTGLLVFTNDGNFSHTLLRPESKVSKTYEISMQGYLTKEEAEKLRSGISIKVDDKPYTTLPCDVFNIKGDEKKTTCRVTIREGKKRQIRKMFEAVRHPIITLRRVQIGKLKLEDLPQGHFKPITKADVLGSSKPAAPKKNSKDDYY